MIGSKVAHYEITSLLGTGGMGEVYRATDSKLGRSVALKFLPAAFAAGGERLTRFRREEQVVASLNHPNIAHTYGLEESGAASCMPSQGSGPNSGARFSSRPMLARPAVTQADSFPPAPWPFEPWGHVDRKLGNQQNGCMKTTVDLPGDLVRQIKLRAVNEGRKLKDTMTDLLRKGLGTRAAKNTAKPTRVKLPLIQCRRSAKLTPDQVAAALLKQETEWHHEAAGH